MKNLLSGRINITQELVNKLVNEFTNGTEYAGQFQVILIDANKAALRLTKPLYDVDEVSLQLDDVNHNRKKTNIQFRIGEVTTKNKIMKPLVGVLKSTLLKWVLQKIGSVKLPSGIEISVNDEIIQLEIRKWLENTYFGTLEFAVVGKLIDTIEIVSARIDEAELVVETKIAS